LGPKSVTYVSSLFCHPCIRFVPAFTLPLPLPLTLTLPLPLPLTLAVFCFVIACPCFGLSSHLGESPTQNKESLMETKMNVYDRARKVVLKLVPLLHTIREHDRSLADQLKRAAQSVVLNIAEGRGNDAGTARARFSTACGSAKEVRAALNIARDWGYIEARKAAHLDARLDQVCAITWCLGRSFNAPRASRTSRTLRRVRCPRV